MTSSIVQEIDQFSRLNPKFVPTGEILKTYMRGDAKIESAQKAILKFLNSSTSGNLSFKATLLTIRTDSSEDYYSVDYKERLNNAISGLLNTIQRKEDGQVIPLLNDLIRVAEEIDKVYQDPDFGGCCTIL